MAKDWRGFASDFAGASEIRFEDFDGHKGGAADGKGLAAAGFSKTWDGQAIMDETARQEKLQALKRKLKDQQDRQKKTYERKMQKELQMADEWHKHRDEMQAEKAKERKERMHALEECQRRVTEAKAHREQQAEAAQAQAAAEAKLLEAQEMSVFLTGVASGEVRRSSFEVAEDKPVVAAALSAPSEEKKEKKSRKPGLPVEAMPSRKKKEHESVGVEKKDKSSVIQQLPQLFPGLRRTAEGKQILENAEPTQSFTEKQPVTKEHLLRNAQIKLMDQLAAQVSEYRKSMKSKMFSPVSPTLEFGDSLSQMDPLSPAQSRLSRHSLRSMGLDGMDGQSPLSGSFTAR
jgi:hypothetical protein